MKTVAVISEKAKGDRESHGQAKASTSLLPLLPALRKYQKVPLAQPFYCAQ